MKAISCFILCLAFSLTVKSQVVINELCPANGDLIYDPNFFDFSGWVELHNIGGSAADIGNFYLSDEEANKTKWKIPSGTSIPANGFLLIWCDSRSSMLHTNFNLDTDGEVIILSNSSFTEIDKITFPEQFTNVSYGRLTDGGAEIGYLASPTPGLKNKDLTGTVRLDNPDLPLKSGRYSGAQILTMLSKYAESEIRFTLDGSEPTATSTLYAGAISITKTTTVKAKIFKAGFLPSKTEVKTFFINEHPFSLPVVSLSTKPSFLWDNRIGIYADGTNGIGGNCHDQPVNWNQDWDRHAVFEYFENTGSKIFDQNVDIRIGGGCSRNNPQKSFVVKARDKFGSKIIEHDFFNTKDINAFGGFILRNAGNDFYATMFRDALMQTLVIDKMDIDYLAYQPTTVYLNGAYWGIQNLREKIDGDYIEANYGIGKDDVDLIETFGNAIEGTSDHYFVYLDSLQKINLSSPEAYTFIERYIDVQEFINYLTAEIYYCNTDWPGNNVKFWRQRSNNGKYRWILWDLDFGFALYENVSFATHPTLDFATDPDNNGWPNPSESTLHLRLLLQNPTFKNKFLQTFAASLSTTFKPERVVNMINSFQNNIEQEIPYHLERWNLSLDNWNYQVERLRTFASQRNTFMKSHIGSFFGYPDNVRFTINSFPASSGSVRLNGISDPGTVQEGFYYRDLPFEIKAEPSPGYKFSHFTITKTGAVDLKLVNKGAAWKYNDSGTPPAADWIQSAYNDATWTEGIAELGYGDGDETTLVSYGPDINNKHITTYFRKSFTVLDTAGFSSLSGSIRFDDGVVVYLNGQEVYRNNMASGIVTFSTLALVAQTNETTYFPFTIPKGVIKPGINVLSVEIHQNGATSSDISFDLDLQTFITGEEVEYTSTESELTDIANSDVVVKAYFDPITASSGLVINEVSAQNNVYEDNAGETDDWIEIYNNGTETIDIANYFITDNLGNKTKHKILEGQNGETLIAPGTYKILWADEDVIQGPLHLNFKLSADGEEVGFYQMVGSTLQTIDEVTFGNQNRAPSYSRIPNITGPFVLTGLQTPMEENIFEEPEVQTGVENKLDESVRIYPNPTRAGFRIDCPNGKTEIDIYTSTGIPIQQISGYTSGDEITLDDDAQGFYLVRIVINGKAVTKRLIRI
jgi:hypothetical protein